jgi:membrane-associated phospholipid phosphatase
MQRLTHFALQSIFGHNPPVKYLKGIPWSTNAWWNRVYQRSEPLRPARPSWAAAAACAFALLPCIGRADNFIDHRVTKDTGGIYSLQDAVPVSLGLLAAGCALWQGTEDRLGKTCWEAGESGLLTAVAAEGLQFITGRQPPSATSDPNRWFSGGKGSFPSTHVSVTTAVVTPFIYQYIHDDPWVAALAALPAYEMVARVKAQQHWQTDVLAGAALGFGIGAYEAHRNNPLVFSLLPGGAYVGFHRSF